MGGGALCILLGLFSALGVPGFGVRKHVRTASLPSKTFRPLGSLKRPGSKDGEDIADPGAGLRPGEGIGPAVQHETKVAGREVDEEGKLRKTVRSALTRADEKGIKRLAFPPIGTGLYQVPLDLCSRVMVDTIAEYLTNGSTLDEVLIVAPDPREFAPFKAKFEEGT